MDPIYSVHAKKHPILGSILQAKSSRRKVGRSGALRCDRQWRRLGCREKPSARMRIKLKDIAVASLVFLCTEEHQVVIFYFYILCSPLRILTFQRDSKTYSRSLLTSSRSILLLKSELTFQARVLLLLDPDLHSLLHAGHRFLGLFLVGCQRRSS